MDKLNLTLLSRHEAALRLYNILMSLPIAKKAGDNDEYLRQERNLSANLIRQWTREYTKILKALPEKISEQAVKLLNKNLDKSLGKDFGNSERIKKFFHDYIGKVYKNSKREFAPQASLSLADKKAVDVLTKHNCFWIGEHYGSHIGGKIAEITQQALNDGLGRKELARELKSALGGKVGGYQYWDVAASAALVRARSFGAISGMEEAGIAEYEILAMQDERMCPICGEMDGRAFSVAVTRERINNVLNIKDPEAFKQAMPWQTESPKGLSNAALQNAGMNLPPFHGRCRCTLVTVSENYNFQEQGILHQSGALNNENDPKGEKRDAHAKIYYETMRNSKHEIIIKKIAKHSGIPLRAAQKVFEHVFLNEYELEDGVRRGLMHFPSDYDMAQSFQRILSGQDIQKHDIILLQHERLECELMNRYGIKDYDTAHNLTNKKHDYGRALLSWKESKNGKD